MSCHLDVAIRDHNEPQAPRCAEARTISERSARRGLQPVTRRLMGRRPRIGSSILAGVLRTAEGVAIPFGGDPRAARLYQGHVGAIITIDTDGKFIPNRVMTSTNY